jgi:hypothetical protein
MTKPYAIPSEYRFKIESGVPLPIPESKPMHPLKVVIEKMEVWDSFLFGKDMLERYMGENAARTAIYSMARMLDRRVTIRKEGDGFRVWRKA